MVFVGVVGFETTGIVFTGVKVVTFLVAAGVGALTVGEVVDVHGIFVSTEIGGSIDSI